MSTDTVGPVRDAGKVRGKRPSPNDVKRLHAAGEGRNSIARTLGVSHRQVDAVAAELGLKFDKRATREAVEARRVAAEMDRAELGEKFRLLALDSVDRALAETDPGDRRRLAMTAQSATQSDLALHAAHQQGEQSGQAAEDFAELLDTIRGGFDTIMDADPEEFDPEGEYQ